MGWQENIWIVDKLVGVRWNQEECWDWEPTSAKSVDALYSIHDGNDAKGLPANQVHSAFLLQADNASEIRT